MFCYLFNNTHFFNKYLLYAVISKILYFSDLTCIEQFNTYSYL